MIRLSASRIPVLAVALMFAACAEGEHRDDGSPVSTTSPGPHDDPESCDLAADRWYSDCDEGCGDVMVCQSFCSDCEYRCMVPCVDSSDCEAVGAGSCEESTYGSNRCSGKPTMCPVDEPDEPQDPPDPTDTDGDTGGDVCSDVGELCEVNGDCCDFAGGGALCVNYEGIGTYCGATCSSGSDCVSGCCAATDADNSVCAPENFCG